MDILALHNQGLSISEIARRTGCTRKTVCKYVRAKQAPGYKSRRELPSILNPYEPYLRKRMDEGVFNCSKLLDELRSQGYPGQKTIIKDFIRPYRIAQREIATVRFETEPGKQVQFDWAHFGKIFHEGHWRKLYAFMMTMGYSRAIYLEFTVSQDIEHFLHCQMHAFRYFGGIPEEVLIDNLKSAVLWRDGPQIRWNARYLDFAAHYGFIPRPCWPYRAQTKGKVEKTVSYVRGNFWVGIHFTDLADLNEQARVWMDEVANVRLHQTTRAVPFERLEEERGRLAPIGAVAPYDPSYISQRMVTKDCLISYRGVRYSVPHAYVGKTVTVREPVEGGSIRIYFREEQIASHDLSSEKGAMIINQEHCRGLVSTHRWFSRVQTQKLNGVKLPAGPGVGVAFMAPEVEVRPLSIYEHMTGGS